MSQGFDSFSEENNPYRSSAMEATTVHEADSEAEAIRRAHIKHEASIKSIGTLYMLGCIIIVIGGLAAITFIFMAGRQGGQAGAQELMLASFVGLFYLVIGVLQGFTAFGLWQLKPWARWVSVVLSAIGLLGFPVGTLICGYFLYLLLSEKGAMIFSDHYKEVIAKTPHIKYKTSIVVWIFLILLIAIMMGGVVALIFGG